MVSPVRTRTGKSMTPSCPWYCHMETMTKENVWVGLVQIPEER
jgi:hypothetical protein